MKKLSTETGAFPFMLVSEVINKLVSHFLTHDPKTIALLLAHSMLDHYKLECVDTCTEAEMEELCGRLVKNNRSLASFIKNDFKGDFIISILSPDEG